MPRNLKRSVENSQQTEDHGNVPGIGDGVSKKQDHIIKETGYKTKPKKLRGEAETRAPTASMSRPNTSKKSRLECLSAKKSSMAARERFILAREWSMYDRERSMYAREKSMYAGKRHHSMPFPLKVENTDTTNVDKDALLIRRDGKEEKEEEEEEKAESDDLGSNLVRQKGSMFDRERLMLVRERLMFERERLMFDREKFMSSRESDSAAPAPERPSSKEQGFDFKGTSTSMDDKTFLKLWPYVKSEEESHYSSAYRDDKTDLRLRPPVKSEEESHYSSAYRPHSMSFPLKTENTDTTDGDRDVILIRQDDKTDPRLRPSVKSEEESHYSSAYRHHPMSFPLKVERQEGSHHQTGR